MYNDLSSFQMTSNSTAECATACATSPGGQCHGWVVGNWAPQCGTSLPTCWLKTEMGGNVTLNPCRISGYLPSVLSTPAYTTMPVGSVSPGGWLQAQLAVQAAGLTGYLPHFWEDIENSTWIGGPGDGGLHERTPYWLNGLVPLSYQVSAGTAGSPAALDAPPERPCPLLPQTGDANLVALRDAYLTYIMGHQLPSGWLGPDDAPTDGNQAGPALHFRLCPLLRDSAPFFFFLQYWGRMNVVLSLEQVRTGRLPCLCIPSSSAFLARSSTTRPRTTPLQSRAS